MTNPLSLDTLLGEFAEEDEVWALVDEPTGQYLTIPDDRHPGRRPTRLFMKKADAEEVLATVLQANDKLRDSKIRAIRVQLKPTMRAIASGGVAGVDGFVVHSPNEVFEYLRDR